MPSAAAAKAKAKAIARAKANGAAAAAAAAACAAANADASSNPKGQLQPSSSLTFEQLPVRGRKKGVPPVRLSPVSAACYGTIAGEQRPCIVLYGGTCLHSNELLDDMWAYDIRASSWTKIDQRGRLPPRHDRPVFVHFQGAVWMWGGSAEANPPDDNVLWRLDPQTWVWSDLHVHGPAPHSRANALALVDEEHGRLIVFGGLRNVFNFSGTPQLNDLWIFSFTEKSWTEIEPKAGQPWPEPVSSAVGWLSPNGDCFAFHGGNFINIFFNRGETNVMSDAWLYYLDENRWEKVPSSLNPGPLDGAGSASVGALHLLFGGWDASNKYSNKCWAFDFMAARASADPWRALSTSGAVPSPRVRSMLHALPGTGARLFAVGGLANENGRAKYFTPEVFRIDHDLTGFDYGPPAAMETCTTADPVSAAGSRSAVDPQVRDPLASQGLQQSAVPVASIPAAASAEQAEHVLKSDIDTAANQLQLQASADAGVGAAQPWQYFYNYKLFPYLASESVSWSSNHSSAKRRFAVNEKQFMQKQAGGQAATQSGAAALAPAAQLQPDLDPAPAPADQTAATPDPTAGSSEMHARQALEQFQEELEAARSRAEGETVRILESLQLPTTAAPAAAAQPDPPVVPQDQTVAATPAAAVGSSRSEMHARQALEQLEEELAGARAEAAAVRAEAARAQREAEGASNDRNHHKQMLETSRKKLAEAEAARRAAEEQSRAAEKARRQANADRDGMRAAKQAAEAAVAEAQADAKAARGEAEAARRALAQAQEKAAAGQARASRLEAGLKEATEQQTALKSMLAAAEARAGAAEARAGAAEAQAEGAEARAGAAEARAAAAALEPPSLAPEALAALPAERLHRLQQGLLEGLAAVSGALADARAREAEARAAEAEARAARAAAEMQQRLEESERAAREARRQLEAQFEELLCLACRDRPPSVLMSGCRHVVLCRPCFEGHTAASRARAAEAEARGKSPSAPLTCPKCRAPYDVAKCVVGVQLPKLD